MSSIPTYFTGQPVHEGDVVRIGEWDGVVETIITKDSADWDWAGDIGEGVMLVGPAFGRLHTDFEDEDLVFIRRGTTDAV